MPDPAYEVQKQVNESIVLEVRIVVILEVKG